MEKRNAEGNKEEKRGLMMEPNKEPSGTLNPDLQQILVKLILWCKIVGLLNIGAGTFLMLTIVALMIPTFVMGICLLVSGLKLLKSGKHLQGMMIQGNPENLAEAFRNLKSYIFLNGLFLVLFMILLIISIVFIFVTGSFFWEMFEEVTEDFVINILP
tara:strand:- start:1694 stop:2167 length:474 start_codon:yes stop_codon:yes gene_type:complete